MHPLVIFSQRTRKPAPAAPGAEPWHYWKCVITGQILKQVLRQGQIGVIELAMFNTENK